MILISSRKNILYYFIKLFYFIKNLFYLLKKCTEKLSKVKKTLFFWMGGTFLGHYLALYFLTVRKIIRFDFADELKIGGLRHVCTT